MAAAARGVVRGGERRPRPAGGRSSSCRPAFPPSLPSSLSPSGSPRSVQGSPAASSALSPPVGFLQRPGPSAPLPLYAWPGSSWIPNRLGSRCPAELDPAPCRSQHTHLEVVTAPKFPWMCSHYIWAKKSACHCFTKAAQFPAAATRPVPPLPKKPTP